MHVVIVAKSLNIPIVSGFAGLTQMVVRGDTVAVDGDNGFVYINPSKEIAADFQKRIEQRATIFPAKSSLPWMSLSAVTIIDCEALK